jgi:hypothetical protein
MMSDPPAGSKPTPAEPTGAPGDTRLAALEVRALAMRQADALAQASATARRLIALCRDGGVPIGHADSV